MSRNYSAVHAQRDAEKAMTDKILKEGILEGGPNGEAKIKSLQPSAPNGIKKESHYFKSRVLKEAKENDPSWQKNMNVVPAAESFESALEQCFSGVHGAGFDELPVELKVAMKVQALKTVEGMYRAYWASQKAAKTAPQQNVQVNVDRGGIAVNGVKRTYEAPARALCPPKASTTIPPSPALGGTEAKSP